MGNNSSSHNVHHIHQPSTASSTLHPSMNHGYNQQNYHNQQQQQLHHQSYPRNNRKPAYAASGFKVLPERVPGQKLRLTDNGSVLQNGGTISGRKILGNHESQPLPQPQYHHHHQHHNDHQVDEDLRRLSHLSDINGPSSEMTSVSKRYSSHPDLLSDGAVSQSPARKPDEMPWQHEEADRLVRKKSPKKGKAPVPPHEEGDGSRSSFMDARRAFANFIKSNSPRKGEPYQHQGLMRATSPDESHRPRMVVYPNPTQQPSNNVLPRTGPNSNSNSNLGHPQGGVLHSMDPPSKSNFEEDGRLGSATRGKSSQKTDSASSKDNGKRIRSMDSLDANGDCQGSFYLKRGEMHKSVDSLHVAALRDDGKGASNNQREIGRRASAASDSFFRRPPGRDESRPNGPDKWLFGRLLDSSREAALLRHNENGPEQPLEHQSELGWKRDDRLQRRESMGNHHHPSFARQQYFYGQGEPKLPGPADGTAAGSLDRRHPPDTGKASGSLLQQKGGGNRAKEETSRGNLAKKERPGGCQQQQLEEFSLREFGRREAALRRPTGEAHDGASSSEDEMDINMQLRPTLPKRVPVIPRFSPTQVWRSLSLDEPQPIHTVPTNTGERRRMSEHSSDEEDNEGDVFEDRIQRVARPVAPPRGSQEKSADSGISRDAGSPLPVVCDFEAVLRNVRPSPPPPLLLHCAPHHQHDGDKRGAWTPEEDLASDFDGGSGEGSVAVAASAQWPVREMVMAHPKLIPRRDMFAPRVPRPGESFTMDSTDRRGGNGAVAGKARKAKAAAAAAASSSSNTTASTPEANGNCVGAAQTFNSVRKLKRSLSGVLGNGGSRLKNPGDVTNFDENWSLSRSLPNSLHNGQEGEKVITSNDDVPSCRDRDRDTDTRQQVASPNARRQQYPPVSSSAALAAAIRADASSQPFRVLPRSESGPIHSGRPSYPEGERRLDRPEAELAGHRRPFTDLEGRSYADERQHARSGSASWWYSPREGHIVYLPEYDAKRLVEQSTDGAPDSQGHDGKVAAWRKPKKFTYQSTVRQMERKQLEQKLSEVVAHKERQRDQEMQLVNEVEQEFQKKRDREKANIRQQLRILSLESDSKELDDDSSHVRSRGLEDNGPRSLPAMVIPGEDYETPAPNRCGEKPQSNGGFFSGIGKWMRRQQRLEKHQDRYPSYDRQQQSRLEPEGAPHSGSSDSWENRQGDLMPDPRRPFGGPGQRHSIAVDGGSSSDDRWPQHAGASASEGGWSTDQNHNRHQHPRHNHNRHQQQGKAVDDGLQYKRYSNPEKPSLGIHHRSQSFSQMWDEDTANRQSGISSARSSQLYPPSKSSCRPVPFGANSRAGQS